MFEEYGIDNFDSEIILSREITQTGSRSRINGCLVNQEFIKNFRELFLDIHSQHQTYSFLQPKYHITLLDSYIKNPILSDYKKNYEDYKNLLNKLEDLENASQKTEEQIDFLKFQVEEIENASLNSISEDEDLNQELSVLENVEKLKELTGTCYWSLSGDDSSILDALYQIKANLGKASGLDNSIENIESELKQSIKTNQQKVQMLSVFFMPQQPTAEKIFTTYWICLSKISLVYLSFPEIFIIFAES